MAGVLEALFPEESFACTDELYADSAIEFIRGNTAIDTSDPASMPAGAKIFVRKYIGLMQRDPAVASESIGGLSHSYRSEDTDAAIRALAFALLTDFGYRGGVRFGQPRSKWGCV